MTDVAQTIFQQLGSSRFRVMTGAYDFVLADKSLSFRIPQAPKNKANVVKIILADDDTYVMTFSRLRALELKDISLHRGLYCDSLQDVFSAETGLYTRL